MAVNLEDYKYDAERCMRCAGCKWVEHIYMPNVRFGYKCPSIARYLFDDHAAYGRLKIALALMDGKLEYSDRLLKAVYRCQLCGACDVGCKRNLDLEPLLVLEGLRAKCVEDKKGPMNEHRRITENIDRAHNRYGAPHENRLKWIPTSMKLPKKASVAYFAGCASSYMHQNIAQATIKIMAAAKSEFTVVPDEWCCGYPLYSTGQVKEAEKLVEHNLEAIRKTDVETVITSCAECYKTIKVDYPKMLGKSTADLGFKIIHITEYLGQMMEKGALKLNGKVDLHATYHDPCNLARLSEPWIHWVGKRVEWGCLEPPKEFRRGTHGVYEPPRKVLKNIAGVELVEMTRIRENAWCCGAGGGVREAYKDFALWTAGEKLEEVKLTGAEAIVTCCPYCIENLREAVNIRGDKINVYDITEIVAKAITK